MYYYPCDNQHYIKRRPFEDAKTSPFLMALFHKWCDNTSKASEAEEAKLAALRRKARNIAYEQFNDYKQPFVWTERWTNVQFSIDGRPGVDSKVRSLVEEIAWHLDRCEHGCGKEFNKECFKKSHLGWEN